MDKKNYPSMRYHHVHGTRRVNSEKHENEVAHPDKGWKASPAELPVIEPEPGMCPHCGQALPGDKPKRK